MYVAIRRYEVDPSSAEEITRHVREGFLPLVSQAPGFIAYYWLDAGNGVMASVNVFEDQAGADESVRLAADYVREHLASLITNPPQITAGEVVAHTK
jgi:quinol monooxygenase YgiN